MKKRVGIVIIMIITLIWGGYAYAYVSQSESQPDTSQNIQNGATGVTFYNNGNTWVHAVAVFENVPKKDGTTGNIYADIWLKPEKNGIPGTASIDLSNIAGYGSQALPKGIKIRMNTWGNLLGSVSSGTGTLKLQIKANTAQSSSSIDNIEKSKIFVLQLPQGVTDNKIVATEDPTAGGEFLSNITSSGTSSTTMPGTTVTWNDAKSFTLDGVGVVHAYSIKDIALCFSAAGGEEYITIDPAITERNSANNNQAVTGESKLPLQKTGLPIIPALLSVFTLVGGLIYAKIRD